MIFGALVAGLIWFAGMTLERAARTLKRPARFVWLVALITSVVVTGMQLLPRLGDWPSRPPGAVPAVATASPSVPAAAKSAARASSSARALPRIECIPIPPWLASLDGPLAVLWIAGSVLWALILVGSAARLRRRRALWHAAVIDGQPLYVSHDEGPALFGIARYSVVVPAWVLELEPTQRSLVLAHEREHARAADPVVLLLGALLVMVQPWNPFVWLLFQRLRFAVEADCDARVLAESREVRAYGDLLIDLGERTLAGAAPVAALSEPHSYLEKRITLMTQLPFRRPLLRSAGWLAMAALPVVAACGMPRPVAQPEPQPALDAGRALVSITDVRLVDGVPPYRIEVFATGPARVGLGNAAPMPLKDTLRLDHLPAMTVDVTDSDVHLRLIGSGFMEVEGEVTGAPATRLGATGREIVLFKGGAGVGPLIGRADTANKAPMAAYAQERSPTRDSIMREELKEAERIGEWNAHFWGIFDRYVQGGLTLDQAADSIESITRNPKTGKSMSGTRLREIQGPRGWPPSAEEAQRAYTLFRELDRRAGVK
jgi:beta-lactamase regulating signal transducer with metallopeptidase domain